MAKRSKDFNGYEDRVQWEDPYHIVSDLQQRNLWHTPDYFDLKKEHHNPVFVYGSLKHGGFLHDVLEGCAFLGAGQTHVEKYYMQDAGSFPCVFELKHGMKGMHSIKGRIQGELYVADPLTMLELDRCEHNTKMYTRKKVYIKCLDQGTTLLRPSVQAWMYIASDLYWSTTKLHDVKAKATSGGQVYEWPVYGKAAETKRTLLI